MKKFLLLVLAIILAFSMIACDDETTGSSSSTSGSSGVTSSTQGSGNGGDNPGGNTPGGNNPGGEKPDDATGLILSQAVITQFAKAASMKLDFNLEVEIEEDMWYETGRENFEMHGIAKFTVTIAKTENGFNLKVDADVKSDEGEGFEPDMQGTLLYIVDGVIYEYNEDIDAYLVSEIPSIDTTEIEAMIEQLLGEINLTEDDVNAILGQLGASFLYAFDVVDNKGSISADYKPAVDAVLNYIKEIDVETKTLESLLNDVLSLVDENLTVEALLANVEAIANMTVEELITALNESIKTSYGYTLQDIYDMVVNDERVEMLIRQYFVELGETEENIDAIINNMRKAKVEELIPAEMKSMTVYQVICLAFATEEEGEATPINSDEEPAQSVLPETVEELMAMVNAILDMTLAELEANLEIPFSMVIAAVEGIKIDALGYEVDVNFKGIFQIDTIEGSASIDVTITSPSEVSGKNNVEKTMVKIGFKLYDISETAVEITVPADKKLVADIFDKECYGKISLSGLADIEAIAIVEIYYDGTIGVEIEMDGTSTIYGDITLDDIDGCTVTISEPYYYDEDYNIVYADSPITIVIDPVNETFEFVFETEEQ